MNIYIYLYLCVILKTTSKLIGFRVALIMQLYGHHGVGILDTYLSSYTQRKTFSIQYLNQSETWTNRVQVQNFVS